MVLKSSILTSSLVLLLLFGHNVSVAQLGFDVEGGWVTTGYNDVAIPGSGGTRISLNEELNAESIPYLRLRAEVQLSERHLLSLLYAPLSLNSEGSLKKDILFAGTQFAAGAPLSAKYVFNSYRLTYRYEWIRRAKFLFGIGFTAKIRDALVRVESGSTIGEKANVGFVPIVNFHLEYRPLERWSLMLSGDALAAPQGRAEDVLLAVNYKINDRLSARVGYRLLEGGADNDEVYSFALFHYASIGFNYKLAYLP